MGQTDEAYAPVLCQIPLDSPTQGSTCTKPRLPFSAVHVTQHGAVHISCNPGAQQLHDGLVGSSTAPQLEMGHVQPSSDGEEQTQDHSLSICHKLCHDFASHLSPQGHILPAGSSHSLSISALRLLN